MEKRLLVALALSFVVLITWSALVPKPKTPRPLISYPPSAIVSQKPIIKEQATNQPDADAKTFEYEFIAPKAKIIFVEPSAAIKEIAFSEYQDYKLNLKNSLLYGFDDTVYQRQLIDKNEIKYILKDQSKLIEKRYAFTPDSYSLRLEISIQNISSEAQVYKLPLALGTVNLASSRDNLNFHDITVAGTEKINYPSIKKSATFGQIRFLGLRDRYFCVIVEPEQPGFSAYVNNTAPNISEVGLMTPEVKLNPGESTKQSFKIYIGPQDLKLLRAENSDWQAVIYFGKLNIISQMLLSLLEMLHNLVHNWGVAIIILSLLIYLLLYPLTLKQMKSMKEMALLQPKIEELRKKYKDNPQRVNKETMELYREHKVNPFGGCLPLLLQSPIFFALFLVLNRSIALKGAGFLWIKDLSSPDRLFVLGSSIPLLGNEINILPVLLAVGMFFQQKSSMASMNSQQAEQQKMMLIIMPVMFGIIFYKMPAGLCLYWFINSALTLAYQLRVAKAK